MRVFNWLPTLLYGLDVSDFTFIVLLFFWAVKWMQRRPSGGMMAVRMRRQCARQNLWPCCNHRNVWINCATWRSCGLHAVRYALITSNNKGNAADAQRGVGSLLTARHQRQLRERQETELWQRMWNSFFFFSSVQVEDEVGQQVRMGCRWGGPAWLHRTGQRGRQRWAADNQMGRLREVGNWGVAKRVVLNGMDQWAVERQAHQVNSNPLVGLESDEWEKPTSHLGECLGDWIGWWWLRHWPGGRVPPTGHSKRWATRLQSCTSKGEQRCGTVDSLLAALPSNW